MRILLTGASGQLGAFVVDRLVDLGHDVLAWSGSDAGSRRGVPLRPVDLLDGEATLRRLDEADPDAVIHAAAVSSAEAVRLDPARSSAINVDATARIAGWCDLRGRRLVFTSTDLVFDGTRPWNREDNPAHPILAYGRTKRLAEPAVVAASRGVVARLSLLFGLSRCGRPSFFDRAIGAMRAGDPRPFFEDEWRTPLDLATAAEILTRLVEGELTGILHVAGRERMSRFDLMRRAATALGLDPSLVRPSRQVDANPPEPRPSDVSLDTNRLDSAFPDLRRPTIEAALRASMGSPGPTFDGAIGFDGSRPSSGRGP